ncbi:MAG: SH3 domain-containing protein [Candidatus Riflebacteria bacterium]|nr:SH3 domain-containing protein [Candidatus Riflebacteria bacterium]
MDIRKFTFLFVLSVFFAGIVFAAIQIPSKGVVVRTNGNGLHLRTGAGTENSVIVVMNEGETIEILGVSGNWYQAKYNGNTGYCYSYYIDVTETKELNDQNAAQNPYATLSQTDPNRAETKNPDPKIIP